MSTRLSSIGRLPVALAAALVLLAVPAAHATKLQAPEPHPAHRGLAEHRRRQGHPRDRRRRPERHAVHGGHPLRQRQRQGRAARRQPDNFVIGIGETHSIREFCEIAFGHVDLDYREYVVQDERFYRPAEVDLLIADPGKALSVLGWEPSVTFRELVSLMVDADLKRLRPK